MPSSCKNQKAQSLLRGAEKRVLFDVALVDAMVFQLRVKIHGSDVVCLAVLKVADTAVFEDLSHPLRAKVMVLSGKTAAKDKHCEETEEIVPQFVPAFPEQLHCGLDAFVLLVSDGDLKNCNVAFQGIKGKNARADVLTDEAREEWAINLFSGEGHHVVEP